MSVRVKLYRANLNKVLLERFNKTYMKYEKQLRLLAAKEIGIRQGKCEELEETVDMTIKELIEKQKPKLVIIENFVSDNFKGTLYHCPNCKNDFLSFGSNYCYKCGQHLDWSNL